jgi:hypothetical protein
MYVINNKNAYLFNIIMICSKRKFSLRDPTRSDTSQSQFTLIVKKIVFLQTYKTKQRK